MSQLAFLDHQLAVWLWKIVCRVTTMTSESFYFSGARGNHCDTEFSLVARISVIAIVSFHSWLSTVKFVARYCHKKKWHQRMHRCYPPSIHQVIRISIVSLELALLTNSVNNSMNYSLEKQQHVKTTPRTEVNANSKQHCVPAQGAGWEKVHWI